MKPPGPLLSHAGQQQMPTMQCCILNRRLSYGLVFFSSQFFSFGKLTLQDCFFRNFNHCDSNSKTLKYLHLGVKFSLHLFAALQSLPLVRIQCSWHCISQQQQLKHRILPKKTPPVHHSDVEVTVASVGGGTLRWMLF